MKIDLSNSELYNILANGTTNQTQFVDDLTFSEFEEIIDFLEFDEIYKDIDIRGLLNGGVMKIVETETEFTVYKLDDNKFLEIQ